MGVKQLTILVSALTMLLGYSYYEICTAGPKEHSGYHYYIGKESLKSYDDNSSVISLSHMGNQSQIMEKISENLPQFPMDLEIQLKSGKKLFDKVDEATHETISAVIENSKPSQIQYTVLRSQVPLKMVSKARLLQEVTTTDDTFLVLSLTVFSNFFSVSRNLIILATCLNLFDLFLPIIIFSECFTMLAFWTNQKHLLTSFYQQIFASNLDVFNIIRTTFMSTPDTDALDILQLYGFSRDIFFNISGEFVVTIMLLAVTLVIKALNVFMKIESFRYVNSKMRPIWNGYIFSIMPRVGMFIGFQARSVSDMRLMGIISVVIAAVLLGMIVYYFAQLIIQVRKMNSRVGYVDDMIPEIGMAMKLNHLKEFDFDCLRYSNLHYPAMNFIRLMLFAIPIGASYDLHYIQYGGAIASQIFYIMIGISSPGYEKTRDKVLYVLCDFLFVILILGLITVGLSESVRHSEVSIIAEKVIFSLLAVIFIFIIGLLILDIYSYHLADRCSKSSVENEQDAELIENMKKEHAGQSRKYNHTAKTKGRTAKPKEQYSDSEADSDSMSKDSSSNTDEISDLSQIEKDSVQTIKKTFRMPKTQVNKRHQGRMI